MKVTPTNEVHGVERLAARDETKAQASPAPAQGGDKVTLGQSQLAEVLTTARQRSDSGRAVRLQELEAALKSGTYRPDVGQLAEKLLSAAEIDARLRALLQG